MNKQKKMDLLAELFGVDASKLNADKFLDDLHWDSIMQLETIVMFKAEFDIKLSPERVRSYVKISDILNDMPDA